MRIIYKSPLFPTSSFTYAHDLKPELAERMKTCFFNFRFTPVMMREFNGNDRFFPINYKEHWAVVREIAEKTGTPYNKAAYEREAKREAEARAKKAKTPPKKKP
jgi:phosphonate transport system substrate-binding protein